MACGILMKSLKSKGANNPNLKCPPLYSPNHHHGYANYAYTPNK